MPKTWRHDDLQHDLADHFRQNTGMITWENMQLGPSGSPRPDVYVMPKSYTRFTPISYEVKISVADYRRDVTAGKWQSYMQFSAGVTFAVPAGLIKVADLPPGCGLIVRGEDGWRGIKAPTLRHITDLPHHVWMKLVIDGIDREVKRQRMPDPRTVNRYKAEQVVRQRYGERLGSLLSDLSSAELRITRATLEAEAQAKAIEEGTQWQIKSAIERASRGQNELTAAQRRLAEALGLPPDTPADKVASAVYEAVWRLQNDAELERLRQSLESIKRAYERGLEPLPGANNDNHQSAHGAKETA